MNSVKVAEEYWELIRRFPLRPIRSDRELAAASAIADELAIQPKRSRDVDAYLVVLAGLIEQYENEHHPIPDAPGRDVLAHLIEAAGVTRRAVSAATGIQESAISDLLAGRRAFTRRHMERFAEYFAVSPAVFFAR